jgi:hypothetical protein
LRSALSWRQRLHCEGHVRTRIRRSSARNPRGWSIPQRRQLTFGSLLTQTTPALNRAQRGTRHPEKGRGLFGDGPHMMFGSLNCETVGGSTRRACSTSTRAGQNGRSFDRRSLKLLKRLVGARGFEPPTPSPPDWCANQAALRSDFMRPMIHASDGGSKQSWWSSARSLIYAPSEAIMVSGAPFARLGACGQRLVPLLGPLPRMMLYFPSQSGGSGNESR